MWNESQSTIENTHVQSRNRENVRQGDTIHLTKIISRQLAGM